MISRLLFASCMVLFLALAGSPGATAWGQDEVKVGCWNLAANAYYREMSPSQIRARLDVVLPPVAAAIATMEPDVIGLVELESEYALDQLVELLDEYHGLAYQSVYGPTDPHLHLGVLAKEEVVIGEPELIEETTLGEDRLRESLIVPVTAGEFDFQLVIVHLKSGSSGKIDVGGERLGPQEVREKQASALASYIEQHRTASGEDDYLVIGDYNMFPRRDMDAFELLSDGFLRFISNEELCDDLNDCERTHSGGNMLDGFGISQEGTREYLTNTLEIWTPFELFEKDGDFDAFRQFRTYWRGVSDHLPLTAQFRNVDED